MTVLSAADAGAARTSHRESTPNAMPESLFTGVPFAISLLSADASTPRRHADRSQVSEAVSMTAVWFGQLVSHAPECVGRLGVLGLDAEEELRALDGSDLVADGYDLRRRCRRARHDWFVDVEAAMNEFRVLVCGDGLHGSGTLPCVQECALGQRAQSRGNQHDGDDNASEATDVPRGARVTRFSSLLRDDLVVHRTAPSVSALAGAWFSSCLATCRLERVRGTVVIGTREFDW